MNTRDRTNARRAGAALALASVLAIALLAVAAPAVLAQQRPLQTEDPEVIGAGRLMLEFSNSLEYLGKTSTSFPL